MADPVLALQTDTGDPVLAEQTSTGEAPTFNGPIPDQADIEGESATLDAAQYFTNADSYSATGLPDGLSINTSTGQVSGTPTTVNTYSTTITGTNSSGSTDSNTFTWEITTLLVTTVVEDTDGNPIANETGIAWWFYDDLSLAPVDEGTGATTDGTGTLEVDTPNASGSEGYLVIELSDGRVGTSRETPSA